MVGGRRSVVGKKDGRAFCLALLGFALVVFGVDVSGAVDPGAVIAGLQNRYGKTTTLSAEFVQTFRDRAGSVRRESGTLLLKKPGLMRWEYREPRAKIFISDGKKTYFYVPAERRVSVESVREGRDPRTPFMFLLGRTDLRQDFSRFELGVESPLKAGNVVLRMWPRRRVENLADIRLECDPATFVLSRITLIQATGERSDFELSNLVENRKIGNETFTFTPPPNVRVEQ